MDRGWRMAFSKHGARMEKSDREVPFHVSDVPRLPYDAFFDG
jgi:hypothetical protein